MNVRLLIAVSTLLACGALVAPTSAKPAGGGRAGNAGREANTEAQVAVYARLDELDLPKDQLTQLKDLAAKVQPGKLTGGEKLSDEYKSALAQLRDAYATGDDDKIAEAQEKIDSLKDTDKPAEAPAVEISDSARKQAPAAVSLLTAGQLAGYFAEHEDDVPDPYLTLVDALDQIADKKGEEYTSIRNEAAEQVSLLLAGLDKSAQQPIKRQVNEWLDRAHAEDASKLQADHGNLAEAARKIVGTPDPFLVLRHWMEREMADLLSNPEAREAIDKELKNAATDE